jgi:hypothetical protein
LECHDSETEKQNFPKSSIELGIKILFKNGLEKPDDLILIRRASVSDITFSSLVSENHFAPRLSMERGMRIHFSGHPKRDCSSKLTISIGVPTEDDHPIILTEK